MLHYLLVVVVILAGLNFARFRVWLIVCGRGREILNVKLS